MSDQFPGIEGGETPAQTGPTRAASVQLRERDERIDHATLMDPANQSLAEALRITFRILQGAMVVLAAIYVLSGFQSIRTNERGVRLLFGEVAAQDLRPGFQFSAPYPIGELVKVDVGNNELDINRAFWPYVEPGQENQPIGELRARASLRPEQDGFLMTGDGAIAHTQWKVQYSRTDATTYAKNVYPEHERELVRAAVQRGIVQAVAEVEIDALLKQGASEEGSVARRARAIAQATLQEMGVEGTGIEIEQLSLESKIPPAYLRDSFNSVLEASSNAGKAREDAQKEGNTMLSNAAGGAAGVLIGLIDRYERQLDAGEEAEAAATLAQIDRVFEGESVTIDGVEVNPSIGGEVSTMLSEARTYRTRVVDRATAELDNFRAKLQQFQTNPAVMVTGDWSAAVGHFFADERVEIFFSPVGSDTLELVISRDPEIEKDREQRARELENEAARKRREQQMEQDRFNTQEGLPVRGG